MKPFHYWWHWLVCSIPERLDYPGVRWWCRKCAKGFN